MKILVIAAHPDDEVLGCGGTTERLKREEHDVDILLLGEGRSTALDNKFDKLPLIKWVKLIEKNIEIFRPDIIFTHYEKDLNIDHRITYQAVITAARPQPGCCVKEIYSFEIPSSTEWAFPTGFSPDVFYDITLTLEKKIGQLYRRYSPELREYPHPRSERGVRTLAEYRGHIIGVKYAEAFETVRRII